MDRETLYVFPHFYYRCRGRLGLLSIKPLAEVEQAVAALQVAMDESLIAEDCARLLLAAPALAELGLGEAVDAPIDAEGVAIDLHWNWEQLAIDIAHLDPQGVQALSAALSLNSVRHIADIPAMKKHMPDVVAAYRPKAEFCEFVWGLLDCQQGGDGPWRLGRADEGVSLCCSVPHETCPADFDPWGSLGGNEVLKQIATRWPELKPQPISHEYPHYQGRYFAVGPEMMVGMVSLGK